MLFGFSYFKTSVNLYSFFNFLMCHFVLSFPTHMVNELCHYCCFSDVIRSKMSELDQADVTQLVLTCLVAIDRLLRHCAENQAFFTQLHGMCTSSCLL